MNTAFDGTIGSVPNEVRHKLGFRRDFNKLCQEVEAAFKEFRASPNNKELAYVYATLCMEKERIYPAYRDSSTVVYEWESMAQDPRMIEALATARALEIERKARNEFVYNFVQGL